MIVEMRTYKLKPGVRENFLAIFVSKSAPEHRRLGMTIAGPYASLDDGDTFFFMRGFPDLQSRGPLKAAFYEGRLWKDELEHILMPMIETYDVVVVDDSSFPIHW
jgi:hypothetical protein